MKDLTAIVVSLISGLIVYLIFHFTHTTELSSNTVVVFVIFYTLYLLQFKETEK